MTGMQKRYAFAGAMLAFVVTWLAGAPVLTNAIKTARAGDKDAPAAAAASASPTSKSDSSSASKNQDAGAAEARDAEGDHAGHPKGDPKTPGKGKPCEAGRKLLLDYQALYGLPAFRAATSEGGFAFGATADYLIGIVPDPEESGHDGYFEALLEGIEEAVAAGDPGGPPYFRDRSWLPWRRGGEKGASHCANSQPGVVLFRPQDPRSTPPRIILLVGETPTWGVRTAQLEAAITLARGTSPSSSPIRILGPTFSGTASSVAATLEKSKGDPFSRFTLVSGTATSPTLKQTFDGVGEFSATVPDDDARLSAMLAYLDRRGADSKDGLYTNVALLSESLTAYGSAVSNSSGEKPGKRLAPRLSLRFPANLAALLDAPIDTSQSASDTSQSAGDASESSESSAPSTPAPATSAAATDKPPSRDVLVLDEVARELSRQRVRFVGVVATEASDVILLTKRLRSRLPDVRFFTLGADIELLDPQSASVLNGMLLAHALPRGELDGQSVSLRNELVRNVFLAGRSLFGEKVEIAPTRISMIGNGALWGLSEDQGRKDIPISWWFVFYASWLILVGTVLLVSWPFLVERTQPLASQSRIGFARHRGPIWILIGRCEHADLRADDTLVTASLLSVAGGAPLLMCLALWARDYPWLCVFGTVLLFGLSWSRVISKGVNRCKNRKRRRGSATRSALVFSVLGSIASVAALGIGCAPAHEATLNLMSGGSAILAGLIGFGMIWLGLWCWRVRLRFLDMHRFGALHAGGGWLRPPIAQALGETTGVGSGLANVELRLLRVLRSPWRSFVAVPACVHILLVITTCAALGVRAPEAFEPGWRNTLVVAFGLLSLLPITGNFSRIISTWIVLIRLLRRLGRLPVVDSLRKLPPELVRDFEGQLTVATADIGELLYPTRVLEKIAARDPKFADASQKAMEIWNAEMRYEASDDPDPRTQGTTVDRARLVNLLLNASGRLMSKRESLDEETRALADELLAQLVAIFIPRYVRHFRLFVPPMLVGSALGVLMTSLYFIQPQRLITSIIFIWIAGMVVAVFAVYTSLDRDAVVSALGNTTAGSVQLDWNLLRRVLTWGVVPVVSLFAAQYPDFSYWVSVLVNGLGKAIR